MKLKQSVEQGEENLTTIRGAIEHYKVKWVEPKLALLLVLLNTLTIGVNQD